MFLVTSLPLYLGNHLFKSSLLGDKDRFVAALGGSVQEENKEVTFSRTLSCKGTSHSVFTL